MRLMRSVEASFDAFVRAHAADLVRWAYLITWDESDAEDLVQECLFVVAKRWPRVRAMEMPLAYTRRVLVNLALDSRATTLRRRREIHTDLEQAARIRDATAEAAFDTAGVRLELSAALGQLPRQQRTVLGLRYFLDLSEVQVAEILGCSVGTVKSNASRGLGRLRGLVELEATPTEVNES
jgi:RNA polymerase sigma-70 factor (sigma-E family)